MSTTKRLSEDSPVTRAAVEAFRRGATPIPLVPNQKRPNRAEWQRVSYSGEALVVREFTGMVLGSGVGVRLGGGLADVDLDHPTARRAAPLLLPPTPMKSGRDGSPGSHW